MNLVSNSLKFTYKGGITIDVSIDKYLKKYIIKSYNYLSISVTDTGIGIDIVD